MLRLASRRVVLANKHARKRKRTARQPTRTSTSKHTHTRVRAAHSCSRAGGHCVASCACSRSGGVGEVGWARSLRATGVGASAARRALAAMCRGAAAAADLSTCRTRYSGASDGHAPRRSHAGGAESWGGGESGSSSSDSGSSSSESGSSSSSESGSGGKSGEVAAAAGEHEWPGGTPPGSRLVACVVAALTRAGCSATTALATPGAAWAPCPPPLWTLCPCCCRRLARCDCIPSSGAGSGCSVLAWLWHWPASRVAGGACGQRRCARWPLSTPAAPVSHSCHPPRPPRSAPPISCITGVFEREFNEFLFHTFFISEYVKRGRGE